MRTKLAYTVIKKLASLWKNHATNDELGLIIRRSRETARNLVVKLTKEYPTLFEKNERYLSVPEVAKALGTSEKFVSTRCENGKIEYTRHPKNGIRLIKKSALKILRRHTRRYCVICRERLFLKPGQTLKKTCSPACRKELTRKLRRSYAHKRARTNSRHGWLKDITEKLPEARGRMVTFSEGKQLTGLKGSQIKLLRRRHLISARYMGFCNGYGSERNKSKRRGPYYYYLSQLQAAKELYDQYMANHQNGTH